MTNSNMKLWDKVSTTPKDQVKYNNSTQRHSIGAQFQKERATEVFGLYGHSWGPVVGTEEYMRTQIGETHLLHYTAVMYYNFDGREGRFPIAASVKEAYIAGAKSPNPYLKVDDEAMKKVRTDALTKGLSELGFNADVYKGYFDFEEYAEYADNKLANEKIEKEEDRQVTEAEQYAEWKLTACDEFALVKTIKAVETLKTKFTRKAMAMGDNGGVKEFSRNAEARINEIREEAKAKKTEKKDVESNG